MYDLDNQCIKVFDGQNWMILAGSFATVNLSYEAQTLLDWARAKKDEEHLRSKIVEEYPQLKEAALDLAKFQEQFDILVTLAQAHKKKESV